jgi:hypothetical protein
LESIAASVARLLELSALLQQAQTYTAVLLDASVVRFHDA